MEFNENLRKVDLSILMEREDEMMCDIRLYEEQILRLQLTLQKKEITVEHYNDDYDSISSKITNLKEAMRSVSIEINSRIKDYDEFGDVDELSIEELVDDYEYFENYREF